MRAPVFTARELLRLFAQMRAQVDQCETIRTDPGEYADCLHEYFTADVLFAAYRADDLPPSPDLSAALNFGIRTEYDKTAPQQTGEVAESDIMTAVRKAAPFQQV